MRHAVIVAHPNPASFNCAAAQGYAQAVRALGEDVVVRDLYRQQFNPCLQAREIPWAEGYAPGADVVAERQLLADAGVFVLVYPLWFNAPPAMLKGYIDRVFGTGFGYQHAPGGTEPLLRGRRLVSITTSGAPGRWVEQTGALQGLRRAFDDHVAAMCGLTVLDHLHLGDVTPGLSPDVAAGKLAEVGALAQRLFAPTAA